MEDSTEETIDTSSSFSAKPKAIDRPMSAIKRMMMEKQKNNKPSDYYAFLCPYKDCGRRFVADAQLIDHIERKHKALKVEEEKTAQAQQVNNIQQTPIRTLPKKVQEVPGPEQQKILDGIMSKEKPKPATNVRPSTSYVPVTQQKNKFKYLKDVSPDEISSNKPQKHARPQTAKPKADISLIERDQFLQNKLKVLENIEKNLDTDILNFKIQNTAKTNPDEVTVGVDVNKKLLLEKSN